MIVAAIPAAIAAIDLITALVPQIEEAIKRGEVSKEDQQKYRDKYNALKDSGFAFTRPEGT